MTEREEEAPAQDQPDEAAAEEQAQEIEQDPAHNPDDDRLDDVRGG